MSDATKLAVLFLYLEMNPDELEVFRSSKKTKRAVMRQFGLSQKTINVVIREDYEEFHRLFRKFIPHAGVGTIVKKPLRRRK